MNVDQCLRNTPQQLATSLLAESAGAVKTALGDLLAAHRAAELSKGLAPHRGEAEAELAALTQAAERATATAIAAGAVVDEARGALSTLDASQAVTVTRGAGSNDARIDRQAAMRRLENANRARQDAERVAGEARARVAQATRRIEAIDARLEVLRGLATPDPGALATVATIIAQAVEDR